MEPLLFIIALTALHLAAMASIDVLGGTKPWPGKLGWLLLILLLPLVGAVVYYVRADQGPKRPSRGQQATSSTMPAEMARPNQHDLAVRQVSDDD